MIIKRAAQKDVEAVEAAYSAIKDYLARTVDYRHWHTENHPSSAAIRSWIDAGALWCAVDRAHGIAGVMVLDHDSPEAYSSVPWQIEADADRVLIVHALGVVPTHLRRGVARLLVESAIEIAREKGCLAVRLDALVENIPARTLYTTCGFSDRGQHTLIYGNTDLDQFQLFEYVLDQGAGAGQILSVDGLLS